MTGPGDSPDRSGRSVSTNTFVSCNCWWANRPWNWNSYARRWTNSSKDGALAEWLGGRRRDRWASTMSGFIHVLLIIATIVVLIRIILGRMIL